MRQLRHIRNMAQYLVFSPPAYFDECSFLKTNPSHDATSGDSLCPLQPGDEVVVNKLQDEVPLEAACRIPATAKFNVGYEGLDLRAVANQSDGRTDEREMHSCRASHGRVDKRKSGGEGQLSTFGFHEVLSQLHHILAEACG